MLILCNYKKLSLKVEKHSINLFWKIEKAKRNYILDKDIYYIKKIVKVTRKKMILINRTFENQI